MYMPCACCFCSDPVHTEKPGGDDAKAGGEDRTVRDDITGEPCTPRTTQ